ncbi:PREDICTED: voltage-dependent calcium channel subunit alpha-2/delta-4 isoform X2 [Rhagoletis zephyria]|uniref:voltage-dependent calcium channel subunit alpha-2/delta-4 isoform X2 n=1 Tax=Rhagoletis zephyria TaxID=28612 RepID=UPI0008112E26|nr:PREDICTED: voltage-dependent calcium channel subunit alpha-2/delta-4 isoform X2 [Rhagoletis zephyria]
MDRKHIGALALCLFVLLFKLNVFAVVADQDEDIPHNEVRNWALKFGVDLWEFGRQFTKMNEIKNRFKENDIEVKRKDGIILLRELAAEVKNFMDFKRNAVMRIMDSAEQAALSELDSQNSHSTSATTNNQHYDARRINEYNSDGKLADGARHMDIRFMRRFERLPVNLSLSSILVPNGVSLDDGDVKAALQWSAHLDPLFQNNLERDPALSWQYFGSSTGFLRRFPGTAWPPEGSKGSKQIHDFRTQNWFVQAASSPKDIMILLDSSSSMSDKSFDLATATAFNILDTLGEDDFVNLITFAEEIKTPVPCFKDRMVRATPDNVQEIKSAVKAIKLQNTANFTAGLEYAFSLLHKYNQSGEGSQCNQAIMLITESTSETHSDIIKQYNWPHMPVRIFTYLIGSDSSSRSNLHEMACSNKGFFVQINDMEDARKKVIDYALVMARPMIMYQADHPVHWSPVFVAGKTGGLARDSDYQRRLVTTVSTPVFYRRNHSVRVANLLGVVGTDVPIEEIRKMIPQHKLGPNGYSFIVDNNGRVLYHPDLRPMSDGNQYIDQLRPRYTSVDITELELPETEVGNEHEIVEMNKNLLYDMRNDMLMPKEGETEFTVFNHFDGMKRVTARTQRYFYGPIEDTPFTLAVVLPEKYGSHELVSQQEIRHSRRNVTEYFKGDNWRVHPDWVYCEYNSVSDLEKERESSGEYLSASREQELSFGSPEEQVLHFLGRAGRPGWKWMSVRPKPPQPHHAMHGATPVGHFAQHLNNVQGSRKAEPYFCDRTLVQSLVRDAMVTDGLDRNSTVTSTGKEDKHPIATLMAILKRQGYQKFLVATSFVATRSGLLRWIDHMKRPEDSPDPHFSEDNARAMSTSWYKRAVDQHTVEQDSFVYSVPFATGYATKLNTTLVTASHAIFLEHRGHKAIAAVVGLQFQLDSLAKHFINITSTCTGMTGCRRTCASDDLDCYVLDNNGFVIISEQGDHSGKFFGQIDGTIMDSLVQDRIYKRVTVNDYQGICSDADNPYTAASASLQPHRASTWLMKYLISMSATWLAMLPVPLHAWPQDDYTYNEDVFEEPSYTDDYEPFEDYNSPIDEEVDEFFTTADVESTTPPPKQHKPHTGPRASPDPQHARRCDLRTDLYMLQPERLNQGGQNNPLKGKLTNCHVSGCERPFSVQKIPHSNLILLVVDTLCPCGSKQLDIEPLEESGTIGACSARRQSQESAKRRRPKKCINYHPEEIEIQQCGRATALLQTPISLVMAHLFMLVVMFTFTTA